MTLARLKLELSKRAQAVVCCGVCLCVLSACSVLRVPRPDPQALGLPMRKLLSGITFQAQKKYQCGPAALAMALESAGVKVTADQVSAQIYTPALKGSLQPELMAATRRHGVLAYPISGLDCLLKSVTAGRPVVVLQNLGVSWLPKWHYALVIGYDLEQGVVILHTGITEYRSISLRIFMNTWRRAAKWGLVVLPPGDIPPCPQQDKWIQAALGLEKARQTEAARQAYSAVLTIWPDALGALMGLGNTSYILGDLEGAKAAFEQAAEFYPRNGDGYNNLAQVLADLGQCSEAAAAISKAVSLGGPHKRLYKLTRTELESGRCRDAFAAAGYHQTRD